MIDPQLTATVKSRTDLKTLLEQHGLRFKRHGRNWVANCPFHDEKTGSFTIFPDNKSYFCFGCHKSGDALTFLMERDGVDFRSALELLASTAGVELPDPDPQAAALKAKKERLFEIYALASSYFIESLEHPRADSVRHYLNVDRHLSSETVKKFGMGYAPFDHDNSRFRDYMGSRGVKMSELADTHLWAGSHPFFRQRVIIPIKDRAGQVIAFSGRVLGQGENAGPKYLNSPTTPIFDKGATLFGLSEAKEFIRKEGQAIIMEGQFDVITAHGTKWPNAVASMGTALTNKHLELLGRFTGEVLLCYDGDAAGQHATEKAIELVRLSQSQQINLKIVELPVGRDPADTINYAWDAFSRCISGALPVVGYFLKVAQNTFDLTSAEGKKSTVDQVMPIIKSLKDSVEREHYLNQLSELTSTSMQTLTDRAGIAEKKKFLVGVIPAYQPTVYMRELALLRKLMQYFPRSLDVTSSDGQVAQGSDFYDEINRVIFQTIKEACQEWRSLDEVTDSLDEEVSHQFMSLLSSTGSEELETDPALAEIAVKFELDKLRKLHYHNVYLQLVDEIKTLPTDDPMVIELATSALQINSLQKIYP